MQSEDFSFSTSDPEVAVDTLIHQLEKALTVTAEVAEKEFSHIGVCVWGSSALFHGSVYEMRALILKNLRKWRSETGRDQFAIHFTEGQPNAVFLAATTNDNSVAYPLQLMHSEEGLFVFGDSAFN